MGYVTGCIKAIPSNTFQSWSGKEICWDGDMGELLMVTPTTVEQSSFTKTEDYGSKLLNILANRLANYWRVHIARWFKM